MKRRDWSLVNAVRHMYPYCQVCGGSFGRTEAAHVIGRARDSAKVRPEHIAFLCVKHHLAYDAHSLDLFPVLRPDQLVGAVQAAGTVGGALRRVSGPLWRSTSSADIVVLDARLLLLERLSTCTQT